MMEFTERAPIEKGFATVFRNRVVPELDRLEAERQTRLRTAKTHAGLALAGGAVLSVLGLIWGTGDALIAPLLFMALAGVAAWLLWRRQERRWSGALSEAVMPAVCDFLGDLAHDREARDRFPLDMAVALGVIGGHNTAHLQDRIEGSWRGTGFELVEAELREKRGSTGSGDNGSDSKNSLVFKGLLFRIDVPEPAPTPILIARDFGSIGNRLSRFFSDGRGRKMPVVAVDHPDFARHFVMHAEDPGAARRYLPPAFLDNLLVIAEGESDDGVKGMAAGFQRDSFYLALTRDAPFLELGGLRQPVGAIEPQLHSVFEDLAMVRRIIDHLHGQTPTG
ncbi:MAG: DUF3137 domain-containing protein [Paracoccaceae bacterium]